MKKVDPFPEWVQEKDYFKTGGGDVGLLLLRNEGGGGHLLVTKCYKGGGRG